VGTATQVENGRIQRLALAGKQDLDLKVNYVCAYLLLQLSYRFRPLRSSSGYCNNTQAPHICLKPACEVAGSTRQRWAVGTATLRNGGVSASLHLDGRVAGARGSAVNTCDSDADASAAVLLRWGVGDCQ
jgi:hypothetical protein